LHCMAIVESTQGERLGITHKGIGVVEHYLMARRLMMRNIYQSQKKLALEHFLVQLLAHLAKRLESHAAYASIRLTRLGQFLLAANRFNQTLESTNHKEDYKRDFLEQNYVSYKELCDYDVFALIKQLSELGDSEPATQIAIRLQQRMMPKILRLDHVDLQIIHTELSQFKLQHRKDVQDWQLLFIQTPHRSYSGENDPILVVNEQGEINPIDHFSFMINAISDKLEHVAFLCIDKMIADDKRVIALMKRLQSVPVINAKEV
jgi:uncharacterized protein